MFCNHDSRPAAVLAMALALILAGGLGRALAETVAHAIDGDTIVMASGEVVRLENVDTPELSCACARECRLALRAFAITRDATRDGVELVRRARTDRYGRTIALVILPDGRDLGAVLIASGLGRPYQGGRRQPWCDRGD